MLKRISYSLFSDLKPGIAAAFVEAAQAAAKQRKGAVADRVVADMKAGKVSSTQLKNQSRAQADIAIEDLLTDFARKIGFIDDATVSVGVGASGVISGTVADGSRIEVPFTGVYGVDRDRFLVMKWSLKLRVDGVRVPVSKWYAANRKKV